MGELKRIRRRQFLNDNPGLAERIIDEVKSWPPMSAEAIRLCREARRIGLTKASDVPTIESHE